MPRPWDTSLFPSVGVPSKLLQIDELSGKCYKPMQSQEWGGLFLLTSLIFLKRNIVVQSPEPLSEVAFPDIVFLFRSDYKPVQVSKSSVSICLEIQDIFCSKYIEANASELPGMDLPNVQWQLQFSNFAQKKETKILPLGNWIRQISLPGEHMLNSHPHSDNLC